MSKKENVFQATLKQDLQRLFPGCIILKNDSGFIQGIPDLTVLWEDKWAVLEVKRSDDEDFEPNQEWYLDRFDQMSFGSMICPENKERVLHALQQAFGTRGRTRLPERQ